MKTLHHVVLGIVLFFVYVWLAQHLYLFMARDACQDAGGAYQAAHRLCSGLVNQEADFGARLPYLGWLVVLGIPALLLIGVQISLHALVTALGMSKHRSRGRSRRR
jgi:hypothetical protein